MTRTTWILCVLVAACTTRPVERSLPSATAMAPARAAATAPCSEDAPTASVAACEASCAAGFGSACAVAADRYYGGDRAREDDAAALRYAVRACRLDSSAGCVTASSIYAGNHDGANHQLADAKQLEPYERRTIALYERDCAANVGEACAAIAYWLAQPTGFAQYDWLPRDATRAKQLTALARVLEAATCNAGHGRTCAAMALDAETGLGLATRKDAGRAAELYARGCDLGYAPACDDGARGFDDFQDPRRIALERRGCELGWGWSCGVLGILTDGDAGIALLERGCELDNRTACEHAAPMLDITGRHAEASAMLRRGCELGGVEACKALSH